MCYEGFTEMVMAFTCYKRIHSYYLPLFKEKFYYIFNESIMTEKRTLQGD